MADAGADPMTTVDPELRPALQGYLQMAGGDSALPGPEMLKALRERMTAMSKPRLPTPSVSEQKIPGRGGAPQVTVYVINSDPKIVRPAILHIHGGGYIAGSAYSSVADQQALARALDCVIVTVEYRLAPEAPFPGALEDNYAALLWLHGNAAVLGVDPTRIAVAGESAGGGHAAMLTLAARDRGEVPICFQALTYPMLDDRTGSSREPPAHIGAYLWTRALNRMGWQALLGSAPGGETVPDGAAPARTANLAGLPPTFIAVGDIDLFVQEDVEFAGRLIAAGVPTELLVVPGAPHGFYVLSPDASPSRRYTLAHANALARALGRPEFAEAPAGAPWPAPAEAALG